MRFPVAIANSLAIAIELCTLEHPRFGLSLQEFFAIDRLAIANR